MLSTPSAGEATATTVAVVTVEVEVQFVVTVAVVTVCWSYEYCDSLQGNEVCRLAKGQVATADVAIELDRRRLQVPEGPRVGPVRAISSGRGNLLIITLQYTIVCYSISYYTIL